MGKKKTELPRLVVHNIMTRLSPKDIGSMARACKRFKKSAENNRLWKLLVERDFGKKKLQLLPSDKGDWRLAYADEYRYRILSSRFPAWFAILCGLTPVCQRARRRRRLFK